MDGKTSCCVGGFVFSTLLAFGSAVAADDVTVAATAVARWQERGDSFLLVDTRTPTQYEMKHARNAINIPAFVIGSKHLPKDAKIVLYDGGAGTREAEEAARTLQNGGYRQLFVLDGGLTAWEAQGQPIVVPPGPSPVPLVDPITADELSRLLERGAAVTVIDLRGSKAAKTGRIGNAMTVAPNSDLTSALASARPSDLIVVYDNGDGTARDRAEDLRRQGFRSVKYLYGGMLAWNEKLKKQQAVNP